MFIRKHFVIFGSVLFVLSSSVSAQLYDNIYRPSEPGWEVLETPHFHIIYQAGEDSAALYSGRILESQYESVQLLVGGELSAMPVVLNGYNDLSNGYVTPFNFRIEVEIPAIKGKTLNPATGGWLENVMPHELVHALHLSVNPGFGFTRMVGLFSSDLARSVHLMSPFGMTEGIAVFHESNVHYGVGGRGNYSFFRNRFNANFGSYSRWGLGDMHFPPVRTRPFNRHYIGGHEFTHWLQYEYGMDITRKNIERLARWPFFGYGYALRRSTEKWPVELYRDFTMAKEAEEEDRITAITSKKLTKSRIIDTRFHGPEIRRPLWLSEEEILFYGSFYNKRPGFWKHNLENGKQTQILETRLVEDYGYDLSADRTKLLYARYHTHPWYHNTWRMDAHEYDFERKVSERITRDARVHAPVYAEGGIQALQTNHETAKWIAVDEAGKTNSILEIRPDNIVEVRPNPKDDDIAVVANRNGVQAVWFLTSEELSLDGNPDIHLPGASIFDVSWSTDGGRLLFSADYGRVMNLFEYDRFTETLVQVTNSLYNAFEGSYSPDGERIVYVSQEGDYQKAAVLDRKEFFNAEIPEWVWKAGEDDIISKTRLAGQDNISTELWSHRSYRTGLREFMPRAILPVYDEGSMQLENRYGISLAGGDILRRHSYRADLSTSHNRLWYEGSYGYSGFFPGFRFSAFNLPAETTHFLVEERGASIEFPIDITTESNIRFSGFSIRPGARVAEIRVIDQSGSSLSPWDHAATGSLYASYSHRLQQNIRDAQPNTGTVLYALSELRLHSDQSRAKALRAGISSYFSPLRPYNQSLRLGGDILIQDDPGIRTAGFASPAFSENVLLGLNSAYSLHARYTIPLWNPDRVGLLLPFQLNRFYSVLFTNTAGSLTGHSLQDYYSESRSVYGFGLRTEFGFFNIRMDIGFAIGYELTRQSWQGFIGSF